MNKLTAFLVEEMEAKRKGGIYHKTQVQLAYNSNRIEGSKLTEEQTRYIFETRTIGLAGEDAVPVDDIIETSNHFIAFDFLLRTIEQPLDNTIIKEFHRIIKSGTADAQKSYFRVGDWKQLANEVGGIETARPEEVERCMKELGEWYAVQKSVSIQTLAEYHYRFERIHPFQDGNGRVGRLILYRECLRNDIIPFIIDNEHKFYYYRGLKEFAATPEYLVGTCQSAQDFYTEWIKYFNPALLEDIHS
ncbi:MAG: Fic family protein [Bacteroidales bacterium]|nr:Fic family protein [Bacteroidales bacterium]